MEIVFSDPKNLYFLFGIPLLIAAYIYNIRYKKRAALKFSNFEAVARVFRPNTVVTHNFLAFSVSLMILIFLVLAAAGTTIWYFGDSNSVDYILAIDASASMTADDFEPNRFIAAKDAAIAFIDKLPRDARIGVVSFSGTTFVEQVLTDDFEAAKESIEKIDIKEIGGTDIGNALVTSTNLLLREIRPKTIILLTDGRSTVGVPVERGIDYVNDAHVMVYTIGIGTVEGGKFVGSEAVSTIDDETLMNLAYSTNGKYYKAVNEKELEVAYSEIYDSKKQYVSLRLAPLLISAILFLLILQWILSFTRYNNLP